LRLDGEITGYTAFLCDWQTWLGSEVSNRISKLAKLRKVLADKRDGESKAGKLVAGWGREPGERSPERIAEATTQYVHRQTKTKYRYDVSAVAREVRRLMLARDRCENSAAGNYVDYGGRGIRFEFASVREAVGYVLAELGVPPKGTSLDRIDNDRGYAPGNLRWATKEQQEANRRSGEQVAKDRARNKREIK